MGDARLFAGPYGPRSGAASPAPRPASTSFGSSSGAYSRQEFQQALYGMNNLHMQQQQQQQPHSQHQAGNGAGVMPAAESAALRERRQTAPRIPSMDLHLGGSGASSASATDASSLSEDWLAKSVFSSQFDGSSASSGSAADRPSAATHLTDASSFATTASGNPYSNHNNGNPQSVSPMSHPARVAGDAKLGDAADDDEGTYIPGSGTLIAPKAEAG